MKPWLWLLLLWPSAALAEPVVVGSKAFTESVVLGELLRASLERQGQAVTHRRELGGSRVLFEALRRGEIHAYPEYTGTLQHELLATSGPMPEERLTAALAELGLAMSAPLGFNNTYALGMRAERAKALGIVRISDLVKQPTLRFGLSSELMKRADGWPGLRKRYGLSPDWVRGMDHDLAYRALAESELDVIDLYSTDAEIPYYQLAVLEDDLAYFPAYHAVVLYRADVPAAAVRAFHELEDRLDEARMAKLNAAVKLDGRSEAEVARSFLGLTGAPDAGDDLTTRLARTTGAHLTLVASSLAAAIAVAIPLGILAARVRWVSATVLSITSILQTVPSLALFVFLIPLFGIGALPATVALFLYSLLPIVRNTHEALTNMEPSLRDSALALGLSEGARLRLVELPLASGAILAGIKTAAVINVGTATIAALIGAGGYGQPILTGIRLDDMSLVLEGAIPAALLALIVQWSFDVLERRLGYSA